MPTLSGYQIIEELYKGPNSLVYRAHRQADQRPVILKLLNQTYPSPENIAWFKREYEITHTLNQANGSGEALPGVVTVYSLESDPQHQWLMAFEDFGGESLARLGLAGRLPLKEFLDLTIQISDILGQVHQRHIMHKDVNPSNIVLNPATGQMKLIDFGIATALSRENPGWRNPHVLEGTLAYLSPEQTGRMNRAIDYRTDFYSLGVTFYELLTGQPPFVMTDPLALVHAHLAQSPQPPYQQKADIPLIVSDIVMKLMAKNAEERYQSAYGLKADLEACLKIFQVNGQASKTINISAFRLGHYDLIDRLQIPQKLYGREKEIETLLSAFERVSGASQSQGNGGLGSASLPQSVELMLVSGYAGIGKSALVQEIYKPITRQRGYFIAGKFDQLQRDTPYAAFAQAFGALIRHLLTEGEAQMAFWREKLNHALGPNGQVISAVIPGIELIIGPQPVVPHLPLTEAQNRFNLVFQGFIRVFTQPEHPLVLFLDDLQWADAASLQLLTLLITAPDQHNLFIVAAYRANEVEPSHPLSLTLNEIRQAGGIIGEIVLTPLDLPHVTQLLADTLHCELSSASPLAQLVLAKTQGNPFFLLEFLKSLYADGLLRLMPPSQENPRGGWQWALEEIQKQNITANVVSLMAAKTQKLKQETQQVLKLAACIGNRFDLYTLAIVYQHSPQKTAGDLWPALQEGLILPLGDSYKLMELDVPDLAEVVLAEYRFAHDRIQQGVYSLMPEADKQAAHWQIGRLLLLASQNQPETREQKIFDIVNQLNWGRGLLGEQAEREELAQLNLLASRKAKASAAYQAAFNYLQVGLELLGEDIWQRVAQQPGRLYELALALHVEAAETAYMNTDLTQMERLVDVVLQQATTLLDKVKVYEVQIQAYMTLYRWLDAVKTGLLVLKLLEIQFPAKPQQFHTYLGFGSTKLALARIPIEALSNLPDMQAPKQQAAMRIFKTISAAVYLVMPDLFPLLVFKQVNLSVKYGNVPESGLAYTSYGIILCGAIGDIEAGYRFGLVALNVLERFNAKEIRPKVLFAVYHFIKPWKEPLRETLKPLLGAYQSALETGDLEFVGNTISVYAVASFFSGAELAAFEQEIASFSQTIANLKQERAVYFTGLYRQVAFNLLGQTENPCLLVGAGYNENAMLPRHLEVNDGNALFHLYCHKLILNYLFYNYAQAVEAAAHLEKYLSGAFGTVFIGLFYFYDSLARLALFPEASKTEQPQILKKVAAYQKKMKKWAKHAPMNFLHKFYLVEAEQARILGQEMAARNFYDQAIDLARENGYVNEEALAYELAGRFYLARGQRWLAGHYLRDARYAYQRWGATVKVKDLEGRYPQFLAHVPAHPLHALITAATGTDHTASALDFASVLKASQAISGEIVLDKLLATLMKIVIENAGAQRGYLLLEKQGAWIVEAEAEVKAEVKALESVPVEQVAHLSQAIINYVARTKENVVLNDATHEGLFTQDAYIVQHQPKSILCAPMINQGKLSGMLYLENNLATGAFTPDRLEVLNILSAQAAISIENARLYSHQVELTKAASRFVPFEFLQFLNKQNITEAQLGDQIQQEMAILVSDIRSFTTLSEMMTPQQNFDFVNAYLGHVGPIIRQHRGFVVKYMGDGIMAVFPQRAEDALRSAIEQLRQMGVYNAERQQAGLMPVQIGLGLHAGKIMMGIVGEAERIQADLLADAVNLAARLEGLSKMYGASIIISHEILARLDDPLQYKLRFLGKVQVKGRQEAVAIFDVFDGDPPEILELKLRTRSEFEEGLNLYHHKKFGEAQQLFKLVLQHNPHDKATRLYLEQSAHYLTYGVPDNWNGVLVLTEK